MAADHRDVLTRPARPPDAVLAYGPGPEQFGEAWWPPAASAEPAGLVLIIHGGFWQPEWDRTHARPLAEALADAGLVVGSVEYRRLGSAEGGGWPETFDDIAAAVDRLPEMIISQSPVPVRTDGVVLVGHSAGGQLALWAAARHQLPLDIGWRSADRRRVRGVVALAPVAELARADREHVGDGAVAELLGGHADEVPARYVSTDPAALLPSGVPTVVIHGTEDPWVPVEHSQSYVARAADLGDEITLVELADTEHFALIDPRSAAWLDVLGAVQRLG